MYQNTILIGNLGDDPKLRFTADGTPVASFSMAVNKRWKDQDGNPKEKTTWFRVTVWRKLAEVCNQYLAKGRLVMVEGEVEASAWVNQDGEARATLELTAHTVKFLSKGNSEAAGAPEESAAEPVAVLVPQTVEAELPF